MLVVTNAKIADLLLGKPEGLHVNDLAAASALDPGKLGRILRLLATKHCFDEGAKMMFVEPQVPYPSFVTPYQSNRTSSLIIESVCNSRQAIRSLVWLVQCGLYNPFIHYRGLNKLLLGLTKVSRQLHT